jgi:predicted nucleic acid-binding Zn ribbon protein
MNRRRDSGLRMKRANPVGLDHLAGSLAEKLGMTADIRLAILKKNWTNVVGAVNARNTAPSAFRDGVLTVEVSSPAWVSQARFLTPSFLSAVNSFDPDAGPSVREIRFVLARS